MAERVGFEPTVEFPLHSLSRRALSTAQTPLRGRFVIVADASVAQQRSSCKPSTATASGWTQQARETLVKHCIYQDGRTATPGISRNAFSLSGGPRKRTGEARRSRRPGCPI